MKEIKVISEENTYKKGKRINTQTIETTTTLADDMATLANYYGALASNQGLIEKLSQKVMETPENRNSIEKEILRIAEEMNTLKQAIALQEQYIKEFEVI